MTGRELLRFVGDLYNLDRSQVAHRIDELLRMFDLARAAEDTVDLDSHGMQQKASLAAALMHDPRCAGARRADRGARPEIGAPD